MQKYNNAKITELDSKLQEIINNNIKIVDVETNYGTTEKAIKVEKGLFLYGKTGVGKTHALYSIANRFRLNVENWVELLFELKDKFNGGSVKDLMYKITNEKAIFLDDVGAEKQTEWSQEMMYLLINRAYERERGLFISTNLTIDEFTTKYGERIVSRLVEMCDFYEVKGGDRRIK